MIDPLNNLEMTKKYSGRGWVGLMGCTLLQSSWNVLPESVK